MRRVADWQLAAPLKPKIAMDTWETGVFDTGVMALGDIAPDSTYRDAMEKMGAAQKWKARDGIYNPDNYVVGQTYLELYLQDHRSEMIAPLREQFDYILAHPANDDLAHDASGARRNDWWWCDTLFMGPGAWARMTAATGDGKYLDFASRSWWVTSDGLYDKDEHLFYRDSRFFDKRGPNGEKIFWSRGNGWVIAGLARLLQFVPEDYPARPRFLEQFRQMADKLLSLQQPDGSWHPSLLNPAAPDQPEASGTGLFTYALAWGVNHSLLDRAKFEPAVWKGWAALAPFVQTDGRLAQTQPGGDRPVQFDPGNNDSFGAGAFLLAGSEVYRLLLLRDAPRISVSVASSLDRWREQETIEILWKTIAKRLPGVSPDNLAVVPDRFASALVSQILRDDAGQPTKLLFQSDFAPDQFRRFDLVAKEGLVKPAVAAPAYARFVPERLDDFAWENERTAHRMYGPALQKTGEISSGVDLWAKRSHKALIDQWYKRGDYHQDHGDGGDFYKTGPTRGCGGLGIWMDGKLATSQNFTGWKVLANGPIRCEFRLEYAPWDVGNGKSVSEVKTISLDAGSNMNRFQSVFKAKGLVPSDGLPVALGITRRPIEGGFTDHLTEGWMSYWSPADPGNGDLGCAVILDPMREGWTSYAPDAPAKTTYAGQSEILLPPGAAKAVDTTDNLLAVLDVPVEQPLVYHAGGGWSKGDFPTRESWEKYVSDYAIGLRSPLSISFQALPEAKSASANP